MKPKHYRDFYHIHKDVNDEPQISEWEVFYLHHPPRTYAFDIKGTLLFDIPWDVMEDHTNSHLIELKRELVCNSFTDWYDKDTKWALIDENGHLVTELMYNYFGEKWLGGQYISAIKEGKLGFIDRDGNVKIDFQFDYDNVDYEWMYHPNFDIVEIVTSETILPNGDLTLTSKKGVVDFECNYIIPAVYKNIEIEEAEYRGDKIEELNTEEVAVFKRKTKIFLEDFDGNHFEWTYQNGLLSISSPS